LSGEIHGFGGEILRLCYIGIWVQLNGFCGLVELGKFCEEFTTLICDRCERGLELGVKGLGSELGELGEEEDFLFEVFEAVGEVLIDFEIGVLRWCVGNNFH
jgi:hypothetical protein